VNGTAGTGHTGVAEKHREPLTELQQVWQRLALRLLYSSTLETPWSLGVTSAVRGEGRTTAAMSIATALAWETRSPILLLEADYESPSLARELRTDEAPGLLEYVQGAADLESIFRPTEMDNLAVIPAGVGKPEANGQQRVPGVDQLAIRLRHQLPEIVGRLKQQFSCIVVDLPPLLMNVHTEGMNSQMDGSVLVVRSGATPDSSLEQAVAVAGEDRLLGIIHMGEPSAVPRWLASMLSE
jgi:Mrp family chromosome partitioning ATPase